MSPTPINVLQLVLSFRPGGRRNAIQTLARGIQTAGAKCDLCCLDELGCQSSELGNEFDSVTVLNRSQLGHFGVARRLRLLCRDREIDLIHAHDAASQFAAALVRLVRPRTKLLMTFHRSLGFESARRRDRFRNAFACSLSGAIVTASLERKEHFRFENLVPERKLEVIPFGIDVHSFCRDAKRRLEIRSSLKLGPRTVVVGAAGHYGREKGIDVAIQVFGELCRRRPELDTVLVVLGSGSSDQKREIEQLAAAHPGRRIVLAGFQPSVRDWYSAFDVFLHAPRLEAFGLVIIEAMAANLPVVATRVGGVPELVRHEQTGLLGDSPAELADALSRLITDPDLRERYGARGFEVADAEYGASLSSERYLDLYHRLTAPENPIPDSIRGKRERPRVQQRVPLATGETTP